MSASKLRWTRAAGLLAVAIACALASGPAQAQAPRPGPVASEARKAGPKATNPRAVPKKKARSSRRSSADRKPALVRKHRPGKPAATAKSVTKKPVTRKKAQSAARTGVAPVAAPPPVARTLPPLGPERFYPHGIPPLHPAFMHPLPGTPGVSEQAAASRVPGAEPEWLP